ncbi:MAG: hypothetical protein HeimC3_24100 [Candidatus Heimdallarchaeota archaeon LC_3]|nr:MAG: hypothetical protein HeimC3_24100 [Candidatus Heimdallarchaeota archaeon LC_3]
MDFRILDKYSKEHDWKKEKNYEKLFSLFKKPSIYHNEREKWYLLGILLEYFGAVFQSEKQELYLLWGTRDNNHFTIIQKTIDALIGLNTRGSYDEQEGIWTLRFG